MGKATNPKRSKGGRPRQGGDRYACGKLKPPAPNEKVVAFRDFVCKDRKRAENPLDAMLANDWITHDQYLTACKFRDDRNASKIGGPKMPVAKDLSEPDGIDARGWSFARMKNEEVAKLWDKAFSSTPRTPERQTEVQAAAWDRYKRCARAMTFDQLTEVHDVAVRNNWPMWMILWAQEDRAREKLKATLSPAEFAALPKDRKRTSWDRQRDLLLSGINAMMEAVYDRKARAA